MADIVSDLTLYYKDFSSAPPYEKCAFWELVQDRLTSEPHLVNEQNLRLATRVAVQDIHSEVRNNALRTVLTIVYLNHSLLATALEEAITYQDYLQSQSVDDRSRALVEKNSKPVIAVLTNITEAARSHKTLTLKLSGQIGIPH